MESKRDMTWSCRQQHAPCRDTIAASRVDTRRARDRCAFSEELRALGSDENVLDRVHEAC